MEAYPQEIDDYAYEHDVRLIIEKSEKGTSVMSVYDQKTNTWEVTINFGEYIFNGQVSPEGVPTEGVIIHNNEDVYFKNNQNLSSKGFAHTIMRIYEKIQEYYKKKKKAGKAYTASRYIHDRDIIKEEDGESSSEEEGNVIHEEPTPPTQQPQNQSNLNLWNSQSQQFGRGWNK